MSVGLDRIEEIGIKVVCLIRSGKLSSYKCSTCRQQKERNCEGEEGDYDVFYHPLVGEFGVCPIKCIPDSVYSFLELYDYCEKYPSTAPTYDKVNPRYWEATKLYDSFMNELKEDKSETEDKEEDERMARMRKLMSRGG